MTNRAAIAEVIEQIALFSGKEVDVSTLSGGAMNGVFLVRADQQRYVVRVPGEGSELLGIDRVSERRNAQAAAVSGASPKILEYLDDLDVMVLEFVEGHVPDTKDLHSPEQVHKMATALRLLHDGPRFHNDVDVFTRARQWLRICDERGFPVPDGLRDRWDLLEDLARTLAAGIVATVPCHNDLSPSNLIDDGERLRIIDFEFSGNNDPCYDLGAIAYEAELDDDLRAILCETYFGTATSPLLARMKLYAVLENVVWSLFCAIQAQFLADPSYWDGSTAYWKDALAALNSDLFPGFIQDASRT